MYNTTKPYTKKVLELIRETWGTDLCIIHDETYPVIEMKHNWKTIDHTDGIGTKGHYHWNNRTFKNAAIDAFAMNANDLAMYGSTPCKIQNHIFLPKDDNDAVYEIIGGLVDLCKRGGIAMTGGETSIHMNMNGMDISVTMTGWVRHKLKDNKYHIGDILIGLHSSGLHSNGFTLVHNTLGGFRPEYVEPTKIYCDTILGVYTHCTGLNHITGGAYTKLKPYLPKNADMEFRFDEEPQQIFKDIHAAGVKSSVMYQTFNCGYGFIVGVSEQNLDYVLKRTSGKIIGHVTKGTGRIYIKSAFDGNIVSY